MNLLDELRKVQGLRGDTYSSAEVVGLLGQAANEIERLRKALQSINGLELSDGDLSDAFAIARDALTASTE